MSLFLSVITGFLLPGNLTFTATVMLFIVGTKRLEIGINRFFLMAWMGWAFVCGVLSSHVDMAIYGYAYRMEGWLTWLVLARLAWLYWECENEMLWITCLSTFGLVLVTASSLEWASRVPWIRDFSGASARIAMGGFVGIVGTLLWSRMKIMVILTLPFLFIADSRSAVLGLVCGILTWELSILSKRQLGSLVSWTTAVCGIVILSSPLAIKFSKVDLGTMGSGARGQWALQAAELIKVHPVKGYGLDTLATVLTLPTGRGREIYHNGTELLPVQCDKTHNIILDILLMTGWPGLILFLFAIGSAIGVAVKYPSDRNRACAAGIIAWLVIGMINPQGIPAHFLFLICVLGVSAKHQEKVI